MTLPGSLAFGASTTAVLDLVPGEHRMAAVRLDHAALLVVSGGTLQMPSRDEAMSICDGHGSVVTGAASVRTSSTTGSAKTRKSTAPST